MRANKKLFLKQTLDICKLIIRQAGVLFCCFFATKSFSQPSINASSQASSSLNFKCDIKTCNSFDLLKKIITSMTKDDLLALDVDHVLIMPVDEDSLNRNPYRKKLWEILKKKYGKEQEKIYYGLVSLKAQWRLVDPNILEVIEQSKKKDIPTIAITSLYTGKFGVIEKIENWRIEQLKKFGLDFSKFCPKELNNDLLISELQSADGVPTLKEGVIFTAQVDKGVVLENILKKTNYKIRRIVFVDDNPKYLKEICLMAQRLGIPFYGIHYNAVDQMPISTISERVEDLRMQILEREEKWLSYSEIGQRILSEEK